MWFICLIIGLLCGAFIVYTVQEPKLKTFVELDKQTAEENQKLQIELATLQTRKNEVLSNINELERQAQDAGQKFLEQNQKIAEMQLEQSMEKMSLEYQSYKEEYETEYLQALEEMTNGITTKIADYKEELNALEGVIADKQSIVAAAVEANKRAAEMENKINFYRLVLDEEDLKEIEKLREVLPYLRDSEPLNKVIWKVYYEKPYTDMIGRVVGSGVHTGIYKITNIENNMCYVGQAANIAERWRQHIKRGIGAEEPTRNKLYPAMLASGVENFTFEIIEECDRELLNSREDYWQEYFKAKEYGYSIK